MCYPRAAEGWTSVTSKDHVSGFKKTAGDALPPSSPPPAKQKLTKPSKTRPSTSPSPSSSPSTTTSDASGTLIWQGKLTVGDHQLKRGFAGEVQTVEKANNKVVIADPTGFSNDTVIKTTYNKVRRIYFIEFMHYSVKKCVI
jgi:hypothetical protein